jgi:hypothetical protein
MLAGVRKIALLTNGGDPLFARLALDHVNLAGRTNGIKIHPLTIPGPDEGLDAAFADITKSQAEPLLFKAACPPSI